MHSDSVVLPVDSRYLPALQLKHDDEAFVEEYVPRPQGMHAEESFNSLYEPTLHGVHP